MRRMLLIGCLLCSGAFAAQPDERRVRTVDIDGRQVRPTPDDDRWARDPEGAVQSDPRRARVLGAERAMQTDDYRDNVEAPERAVQSDQRRAGVRGLERGRQPVDQGGDAAQPDDHLALARRLVDLGLDGDNLQEVASACIPDAKTMRADIVAAYRANPRAFQGISPRSAYWPDVERIWRDYYVERCAAQSEESPAEVIARMYAANLSTEELSEILAFQESPTGRAYIAAARLARQDLESAPAAPATQRDADQASDRFRQAMLRLKARYDRAPR